MAGEPASVDRWIRARTISKNRTYASRIVRQYGIHLDDPIQILDVCNALSLNDAYWVVPDDSNATFAEKNLYENNFDDLVATVAFSGHRRLVPNAGQGPTAACHHQRPVP